MPTMTQINDDLTDYIRILESKNPQNLVEKKLIDNSIETVLAIAMWIWNREYIRNHQQEKTND